MILYSHHDMNAMNMTWMPWISNINSWGSAISYMPVIHGGVCMINEMYDSVSMPCMYNIYIVDTVWFYLHAVYVCMQLWFLFHTMHEWMTCTLMKHMVLFKHMHCWNTVWFYFHTIHVYNICICDYMHVFDFISISIWLHGEVYIMNECMYDFVFIPYMNA